MNCAFPAPFSTAEIRKIAETAVDAFSIWPRAVSSASRNCSARLVVEGALDPGAGDGERRAQIVGDVVARALELLEQARDLVEHEIDGARHFVDVAVLVGDRQT